MYVIFTVTWLCFVSGDVGHYDEEGNIFIVDRIKELIKYKGLQVHTFISIVVFDILFPGTFNQIHAETLVFLKTLVMPDFQDHCTL